MHHDQAIQLRQLVSERAQGRAIAAVPLVVVGGSRGCGTTSIALNLAVALARQGRRAVFVDGDLAAGKRVRIAAERDSGTIVDVLAGRRSLHEVLSRGPFGVQIVPGAELADDSREASAAAQNRLMVELERLTPHADVIVIDTGATRGGFAGRCWQAARAVCLVTTPADAAMLECYTTIKTLSAGDTSLPLYTIINRADEVPAAQDIHARLAATCQRFLGVTISSLGNMPTCDTLSDRFEPYTAAGGDAARGFDRAAETLWAQMQAGATGHVPRLRMPAIVGS
jgi:flagellar biosynthesis protein FlhG